jgi:hypothetical protein
MARKKLLVCGGSHCRKMRARDDRFDRWISRLSVESEAVGCQKVCRGPVVGIDLDGRLEWFERMDSPKALRALEQLIVDDTLGKPLRKRRSRKRAGRLRS